MKSITASNDLLATNCPTAAVGIRTKITTITHLPLIVLIFALFACAPIAKSTKTEQGKQGKSAGVCTIAIKAKCVLTSTGIITDAYVQIDDTGKIITISKTLKNAGPEITVIDATSHVLSPGFINAHDHLSYNLMPPLQESQCAYVTQNETRYDQRNDWRKGKRQHKKLSYYNSNARVKNAWFELRQLISGTTTIVSNGGVAGLCRNLGNDSIEEYKDEKLREGIVSLKVVYDVFPLGDVNGEQREHGTDYKSHPDPGAVKDCIYVPHVSEGVDQVARNEFYNIGSGDPGCVNILSDRLMLIHSIALLREDVQLVADSRTSLVWSPRSNISLYGNTTYVPLYKNLGVNICLGTDWSCSGSMNLLRELALVSDLNKNYFNNTFTSKEMWSMVTVNPAKALQVSDQVGDIRPGLYADIVAFKISSSGSPYEIAISAPVESVALVCRSGKIIYGDKSLLENIKGDWDELSVNGVTKLIDLRSEIQISYNDLVVANKGDYPLFFKGIPPDEPCGKPIRLKNPQCPGIGIYPIYSKLEDTDQDGVKNGADNYPNIFNPIRPVDYSNDRKQCEMK